MTDSEAEVIVAPQFSDLLGLLGRDGLLGAMDVKDNLVVEGHGGLVIIVDQDGLLRLQLELLRGHDMARGERRKKGHGRSRGVGWNSLFLAKNFASS